MNICFFDCPFDTSATEGFKRRNDILAGCFHAMLFPFLPDLPAPNLKHPAIRMAFFL
jgi:hypothetical protein